MMSPIVTIGSILLHGAAIFTLLVRERRHPSATLAWLLALVFIPVAGLIFYLLFGLPRARRVARRYADVSTRLERVFERHGAADKMGAPGDGSFEPRTQALFRLGKRLGSEVSLGNRVDILVDAQETYQAMAEAIAAAQHHVHVEFYIIQPDRTGYGLRDILAERARAGVEVRVLCDGLGSAALPDNFWLQLEDEGGEAAVFRPVARILTKLPGRDRIDLRNHRKLVIVDGVIGFTGGINIGREYLGLDPEMGYWRDTHLRVHGPAVLGLQRVFAEDWLTATERLLDSEIYFPDPVDTDGPHAVQVIDSGPDRSWSSISYLYTQAFSAARERLWITSPYFVPSRSIEHGLITAALRGVDVRLLVPLKADSGLVMLAGESYFRSLLEAGVRIFRYERGFVHAKTFVVDDWVASVGSANMDMRSFHLNYELNAIVYGSEFAETLAGQFLNDTEGAREVTMEENQSCGSFRRVGRSVARLLSPFL